MCGIIQQNYTRIHILLCRLAFYFCEKDDVLHLYIHSNIDCGTIFAILYMNLCVKNKEQISERFDFMFNVQRTEKLCSMTMKKK